MEASQTGKGQFYYYFGSKEGLIKEVVNAWIDGIRSGQAPIKYGITDWNELEQWFYGHLALQTPFNMTRGCPMGTLGSEITIEDEELRQVISVAFEEMRTRLRDFFAKQIQQKNMKPETDPEALSSFCLASVQGGVLLAKVHRDQRYAERAFDGAIAHVNSLRMEG